MSDPPHDTTVVYVPSQSEPGRKYMVVRGSGEPEDEDYLPWFCNCPAFKYDARHYADEPGEPECKHIQAVKLLDKEGENERGGS